MTSQLVETGTSEESKDGDETARQQEKIDSPMFTQVVLVQKTSENIYSSSVKSHIDSDMVKMRIHYSNGTRSILTFEIPDENCTVQDLLNQACITSACGKTSVFLVTDSQSQSYFTAQVGLPETTLTGLHLGIRSHSKQVSRRNLDVSKSTTSLGIRSPGFEEDSASRSPEESNFSIKNLYKENQRIDGQSPLCFSCELTSTNSNQCRNCKRKLAEDKKGDTIMVVKKKFHESNNTENIKYRENTSRFPKRKKLSDSPVAEVEIVTESGEDGESRLQMTIDSTAEYLSTSFHCHIVMIGSYLCTLEEEVIISESGIRLKAPVLMHSENFVLVEVKFEDILKVLINFHQPIPALFFWIKKNATDRIREQLGMRYPEADYFDSTSADNRQRRLTILPQQITEEAALILKTIFSLQSDLLNELTPKAAQSLLKLITPKSIWLLLKKLIDVREGVSTSASTVDNTINYKIQTLFENSDRSLNTSQIISTDENIVTSDEEIHDEIQTKRDTTLQIKDTSNDEIHLCGEVSQNCTKSTQKPAPAETDNDEAEQVLVYPRPPANGGIPITSLDYACLRKGQYLNDIIIDFYLTYITRELLSEKDRHRTHIFSSHFCERLRSVRVSTKEDDLLSTPAKRYAGVRKWTKNVNIFEKDFIIIPINKHGEVIRKAWEDVLIDFLVIHLHFSSHWFVAIICFPGLVGQMQSSPTVAFQHETRKTNDKITKRKTIQKEQACTTHMMENCTEQPCILIFDSLAKQPRKYQTLIRSLREYLTYECRDKLGIERIFSKETMKGVCPQVPQQSNSTDCGIYLLQYVESFFNTPITDYTPPIEMLKHWFEETVVSRKRKEIRRLLVSLLNE